MVYTFQKHPQLRYPMIARYPWLSVERKNIGREEKLENYEHIFLLPPLVTRGNRTRWTTRWKKQASM